jgi:hypothetical protein
MDMISECILLWPADLFPTVVWAVVAWVGEGFMAFDCCFYLIAVVVGVGTFFSKLLKVCLAWFGVIGVELAEDAEIYSFGYCMK